MGYGVHVVRAGFGFAGEGVPEGEIGCLLITPQDEYQFERLCERFVEMGVNFESEDVVSFVLNGEGASMLLRSARIVLAPWVAPEE